MNMKGDQKDLMSISMNNERNGFKDNMILGKGSPSKEKKQASLKSSFEFFGESNKNRRITIGAGSPNQDKR